MRNKDFTFFLYIYLNYREKRKEKERDEMWKKLAELERRNTLERNALAASSNNPVPVTNTSMTRTRP